MAVTCAVEIVDSPLPRESLVEFSPGIGSQSLDAALKQATSSYTSRYPASKAHHENAVKHLPGGNTRSVLFNDPFPVVMKRGVHNRLWDDDGNEYLDLVGELTAGLYGHNNPILQKAVISTYQDVGVNLGATTMQEARFAEAICQRFPSVEQLRFCNSGTEANIYALGLAKHITGKRKIVTFKGAYHGGVLSFVHGVGKNNVDPDDWIIADYNDSEGLTKLMGETDNVAAVIVEAMQGAGGCIPATREFLETVQWTAKKNNALFILDEVMTSRLSPSGLQGKYSLDPDLTTMGKYLGGGMAIGVFGGKKHLLAAHDPRIKGSLPHSGTFNNNSLTMTCGFVGLTQIYTPSVAEGHNALGDYFRGRLEAIAQGTSMVITGIGAVLTIHFLANGKAPVREADLDTHSIPGLGRLFWFWCLENGFWITERGMISIIVGTKRSELDSFVECVEYFLKKYESLLVLGRDGSAQ
ncbi:acetylornithine aminotransferase [Stachybotrys elegans]|uniref:Acetylornithine aminotransferase n=1 Tax=Stachybotrys elegans TaxID=80388 RepID=A0A8K0SVN7_9HYPO|nr:acetylornithine aminotransferase [Stachybotrys elegans]